MQLSLRSQSSGYTLFQLFQDIISHEKRSFLYLENFKNDLLLYSVGNDTFGR